VSTPLPQLHQGRDGETQLYKLVNELRRYAYSGPGNSWCIASEAVAAFRCVGRDTTTNTAVLARADGSVYAMGIIPVAVAVGELAQVITGGILLGAVSGRVANDTVWVGDDGSLVFAAPGGASYVQPVAVCVNATDIFVSISAPVI